MWSVLNACFELVAAVLAWRELYALRRAETRGGGTYWPRFVWTALWGVSCVPYYLERGDHLSLVGACVRDVAVLLWLWVYWSKRG